MGQLAIVLAFVPSSCQTLHSNIFLFCHECNQLLQEQHLGLLLAHPSSSVKHAKQKN